MATSRPAFAMTIGSTTLSSSGTTAGAAGVLDAAVGAASSALGLGGGGSGAQTPVALELRMDADLDAPGVVDAWLGSAAGLSVTVGDALTLDLGYGDDLTRVFSGSVTDVETELERLHIRATTDDARLLPLRVNQVYENQSAGQIVSDLAAQAGVSTGRVQNGLDLPFYVVDDGRSVYRHCRDLAERIGFELFVSADGELTFAAFDKQSADHSFGYAVNVLGLRVTAAPPMYGSVEVWGESPASSEGAEAASWLVRDFSGSVGRGGSGTLLRVSDVAVRTRDAAGVSAEGRLAAIARRATFGEAVVLGAPKVVLGDAVAFDDVPDARLGGVFQVKRVTHTLAKADGFTTRLELRGAGGGSLLGGLL